MIQRAVIHVQSSGREEVTGANVLVAIFAERESHAAYFLQEQDMTRYDAVNYISHGIAKRPGLSESRTVRGNDEESDAKGGGGGDGEPKKKGDALEAYCINLNKKAKDGKIDPLIGRDPEINRTIQVLCRRQKNNPLYVGEAGVGKTAIAEGWRAASSTAKCRMCSRTPPCSRSTWARCWPARATAATSRSGSSR